MAVHSSQLQRKVIALTVCNYAENGYSWERYNKSFFFHSTIWLFACVVGSVASVLFSCTEPRAKYFYGCEPRTLDKRKACNLGSKCLPRWEAAEVVNLSGFLINFSRCIYIYCTELEKMFSHDDFLFLLVGISM